MALTKYLIGEVHSSKNCGDFIITGYVEGDNQKRYIKFISTGYDTVVYANNIKNGEVKDLYYPSVRGVGCIGFGIYFPHKMVNGRSAATRTYIDWKDMLKRCYSSKFHEKYPTYKDCTVSKEFLDFQQFSKWHELNYPKESGRWELDKDIKIKNNKIYSPDTCMFVSKSLNVIAANCKPRILINPRGRRVLVKNLKDFCEKLNLTYSCMRLVCVGKQKQHKGWTVQK